MSDPDDSNLLIHQEPPPSLLHIPDIDHDLHDSLEANNLAMLRLNSNSNSNFSSKPDEHLHHHHKACSTCGCTRSFKRRPPSLSSSFQDSLTTTIPSSDSEPTKPKKLFLDQDYLTLLGFSKLSLPPSAPAQTQPTSLPLFHPVLCRSASDPFNSPPSKNAVVLPPMDSLAAESGFPVLNSNPHSPEHARTGVIQVTPPSNSRLPPLPPTLRRSISDPNPSPAKTHSWSSSSGDVSVGLSKEKTPNSKRLRRMKDRMNEMNKWCEQVIREQQEEEDGGAEHNNAATKDDSLPDFEESVFVERVGEGLTVRFKCPCGKGYQILLSGRDCYYKLM
ncbi:hypothetical protein F2P56_015794 [Juglans regia]|uniref:Uncharacterized protein n=2 Tax=Juglans regia TaxID=51240 RepID=A0A833XGB1_JUGRE|nr:uncharacterized protein LOC109010426 isoform X2 [Juglans regia]KAF5465824.1 hypothetical protein F2P56_015794 [Juglans regia]